MCANDFPDKIYFFLSLVDQVHNCLGKNAEELVKTKHWIINLVQKIVSKTYGKFTMNTSKKIIVCNEQVKNWLDSGNKSIFIPNAVDIDLFKPVSNKKKKQELRKKYNLPLYKPIIIFVGRLVEKKGFDKLFEARDKNYYILFVGEGEAPEEMQNKKNIQFIHGIVQMQQV